MPTTADTEERAVQAIAARGGDVGTALFMLEVLRNAGLRVADEQRGELVVRWVNVNERSVPPEADTIIRTITRTLGEQSTSTTHWLDGLRGPTV